jgi:hypothetical protein
MIKYSFGTFFLGVKRSGDKILRWIFTLVEAKLRTTSVVYWSDFLAANPEVPG